jgi:hypothetical protein
MPGGDRCVLSGDSNIVSASGFQATGWQAAGVQSPTASTAPVAAQPGPGLSIEEARKLIQAVNADKDIQTSFAHTPKPDPNAAEFWRKLAEDIGKAFKGVSELLGPVAPVLPYLLYALGIAVILLLLSPVVRLFLTTRFERLIARDHLRADAAWRPSRAAVVAILSDIDALAGEGRYDEAVHLLLVRSVADINAFRPDMVRPHYSSRDILTHPLLPEGARPAFRAIVEWVEKSYFAGLTVGKAGFDACRQAYVDFVAAEGIA